MSDGNYQIRREEWDEVRATLKEVRDAVLKLAERENARDDRIAAANEKAESAHAHADRAHTLANDLNTRVTRIEERTGVNSTTINDWKGVAYRVIGGLTVISASGVAAYFMAGPGL